MARILLRAQLIQWMIIRTLEMMMIGSSEVRGVHHNTRLNDVGDILLA